MSMGKAAAQAGHAYTNSLLTALKDTPELAEQYEQIGAIGTKICLKAKSLMQIRMAHDKAIRLGLPCSLITDSGHIMPPHFDGSPIITALGIGPLTKENSKFLSKFKLVS